MKKEFFCEFVCDCREFAALNARSRKFSIPREKWIPVVCAWLIYARAHEQEVACDDFERMLRECKYEEALAFADKKPREALRVIAEISPLREGMREILAIKTHSCADNIKALCITFEMLRIFDPRCLGGRLQRDTALFRIVPTEYLLKSARDEQGWQARAYVVCEFANIICSALPSSFASLLVDASRALLGYVGLREESELIGFVAQSPLHTVATQEVHEEYDVLEQLNEDTFIAAIQSQISPERSGVFLVQGPIENEVTLRSCVNLDIICRAVLRVPRDGGSPFVLAVRSQEKYVASRIFISRDSAQAVREHTNRDGSVRTRPVLIFNAFKAHGLSPRSFVLNCLWRFIARLSKSSPSADIIVDFASGRACIFAHGEQFIDRVPRGRAMHACVYDEISRDRDFYEKTMDEWAKKIDTIAEYEEKASLVYPKRESQTGISAEKLRLCAGRARYVRNTILPSIEERR